MFAVRTLTGARSLGLGLLLLAPMIGFGADPPDASRGDRPASRVTLKEGDRIVFLGDSITEAGAGPKGYVSLIRQALQEKHKDLHIEIIGAGISGNKVPDLQRRVEKDVIARKPTIVVIYIGINDVWHGQDDPTKGTSKEKFEEGLKEVIGKCRKAGAQVILCTPSVIGEKPDGGNKLDARLDEYADISRKVAGELKIPLCDLRKAFLDYLKEHNPEKKAQGVLTSDTVHLNDAGNKFVAEVMLKCLGQ
jgi:lysophospholipase L1-like esterase